MVKPIKRPARVSGESVLYGFLLTPYGLLMLGFAVLTLTFGLVLSLLNIDLIAPAPLKFLGLSNFSHMFADPTFVSSLKLSAYFLTVPVLIEVGVGLIAALVLQHRRRTAMMQALLIVPMFVPPVVAGLFWKLIMTPGIGGLDAALSGLGLPAPAWLQHGGTALTAVTIADIWEWFPFAFVFLFAALRGLPGEPYEAAEVDGASGWQSFRYITFPMLQGALITAALLEVVNSLFLLPLIYTMTAGGPGTATEPLDFYAFVQGFQYFNLSYAAALLVILMAIVLVPLLVFVVRLRKKSSYGW